MKMLKLNWADFKANVDSMQLDVSYYIRSSRYFIFAFNGPFEYTHEMDSDSNDFNDFNLNYLPYVRQRQAVSQIKIQEESYFADTEGIYQAHGFKIDIPSGAIGDWASKIITFDFNMSLFSASWHTPMLSDGDLVEFYIAPDTIIGALTQDAIAGDTVLHVSQTVIDNIKRGYYIDLLDSSNGNTEPLRIKVLSYDDKLLTLTLKSGITMAFTATNVIYIRQTIKMIDDVWLTGGESISLGKDTVGGSYMPKGTPFLIKYQNNSVSAKTFKFLMEYKY